MSLTGTDRGVGSRNTASETTYPIVPGSNCTAGARLLLFVAYDNSGTSGADPVTAVPTDTKSNTWTLVGTAALNDPGAANAGTAMRCWTTVQNGGALLTTDTITVSFAGTVTVARAFVLHEITATSGSSVIEAGAATNATGSSTTPSITTGTVQVGQMIVGAMGSEGNSAVTADSDTTNGSWTTAQASGIGTTTSGMQIHSQRKVQTTAASAQTYNLVYTTEDWCIFAVIVTESVAKSDTETNATSVDVDSSLVETNQVTDAETNASTVEGESVDTGAQPSDDDPATAADAGESVAVAVSGSGVQRLFLWNNTEGLVAGTTHPSTTQSLVLPAGTDVGTTPASGRVRMEDRADSLPLSSPGVTTTAAQTAQQSGLSKAAVSRPFSAAATFGAGTWTFGTSASESNIAANAFLALSLYVWRPGTGLVGRIYDSASPLGNEFATSRAGRVVTFTGIDIAVLAGDRLILEVWFVATQDSAASNTLLFGYVGGSVPVTEGYTGSDAASYLDAPSDVIPLGDGGIAADTSALSILLPTEMDGGTATVVTLAQGGTSASAATHGTGGQAASCVGDTAFSGGDGADATTGTGNQAGGGGGSSGGTAATGNNATGTTGGTAPTGGGAGGGGGAADGTAHPGVAGSLPGGGAGGSSCTATTNGGTGNAAGGRATFTYTPSATVVTYDGGGQPIKQIETPPSGTTQVVIECWGAGGQGAAAAINTRGGGGGGGGAYAKTTLAWDATKLQFLVTGGQIATARDTQVVLASAATATDAGEAVVVPRTDDDPAAGADAGESLADTLTDDDPASGVDAGENVDASGGTTPISDDDPATAADAGEALAVTATDDDPATSVDAGESLADTPTDAETGTALDAGEALALDDADTGTGADAGEALADTLTDPDTGAVDDAGEALTTGVSDDNPATGADAGEALAVTLADDEPGTGVEDGAIAAALTDTTEAGAAVDAEASLGVPFSDDDPGSGGETEAIAAAVADDQTGAALDTEGSVAAGVGADDPGSAVDTEAVAATTSDVETGTVADDGTVAAGLSDADTLTVAEDGVVAVGVASGDTATVDDIVALLDAVLADADTGVGDDTEESLDHGAVDVSDADAGTGDDDGAIAVALVDGDTAISVEDAAVLVVRVVFMGGTVRVTRTGGTVRLHWEAQGRSGSARVVGSRLRSGRVTRTGEA